MLSPGSVGTFGPVKDVETWALRAVWLVTPLATGPVFTDALGDAGDPFRIGVTAGLWAVWAAVLMVMMVPRAWTLTTVRVVVPAGVPAFVWAAIASDASGTAVRVAGGVIVAAAAALSWRAPLADRFVDGSSYGDESRFLLRTPGPLAVGPLAVVWVVTVVAASAGVLLLLAERWIAGPAVLILGAPIAQYGVQAIHRLSNRWLVFVPAGVVLHDKTALREPQLFRTGDITALGPAPLEAPEEDLTLDAMGLALRVRLGESSKILPNGRSPSPEPTAVDGFLFTPVRPGAVVAEARRRGLPIG